MDKAQFFKNLTKELARKYHANPMFIVTIRSSILGQKMSPSQIIEHAHNKISLPHASSGKKRAESRRYPKEYYRQFLSFFKTLSSEAYQDIIQKTEFDK